MVYTNATEYIMQLDFFDDSVEQLRNTDGVEKRVCKKCNQEKLFTDFHFCDNKKFRRRICKSCYNKETTWRGWNRHKHTDKKTGKCDCCGKKEEKLNLDHDHDTKQFRGWLCSGCNLGIGKLGDNLESVKKALEYLERHYGSRT